LAVDLADGTLPNAAARTHLQTIAEQLQALEAERTPRTFDERLLVDPLAA